MQTENCYMVPKSVFSRIYDRADESEVEPMTVVDGDETLQPWLVGGIFPLNTRSFLNNMGRLMFRTASKTPTSALL